MPLIHDIEAASPEGDPVENVRIVGFVVRDRGEVLGADRWWLNRVHLHIYVNSSLKSFWVLTC